MDFSRVEDYGDDSFYDLNDLHETAKLLAYFKKGNISIHSDSNEDFIKEKEPYLRRDILIIAKKLCQNTINKVECVVSFADALDKEEILDEVISCLEGFQRVLNPEEIREIPYKNLSYQELIKKISQDFPNIDREALAIFISTTFHGLFAFGRPIPEVIITPLKEEFFVTVDAIDPGDSEKTKKFRGIISQK